MGKVDGKSWLEMRRTIGVMGRFSSSILIHKIVGIHKSYKPIIAKKESLRKKTAQISLNPLILTYDGPCNPLLKNVVCKMWRHLHHLGDMDKNYI